MSNQNTAVAKSDFFGSALARINEEIAAQAARRAEEEELVGGGLPYVGIIQPMSPLVSQEGAKPGSWYFKLGEEKIVSQWFTYLPIDIIGTATGKAKSNPSIWRWSVPMNKDYWIGDDDREEYGFNYVQFSDGRHPDPAYIGRKLIDTRISGKPVLAQAGYNSTKTVRFTREVEITENTTADNCQLAQWLRPVDADGNEVGKPVPPLVKPVHKLVVLPVWVEGYGMWDNGPVQIEIKGQAERVVFNNRSKHDVAFRKELGIEAYEAVANVKEFPIAVIAETAVVGAPFVMGSISTFNEEYNSYTYLPVTMSLAAEMDGATEIADAFKDVANVLARWYHPAGKKVSKEFYSAVKDLLDNSIGIEDAVQGLIRKEPDIFNEYDAILAEYNEEVDGVRVGRAMLTKPWNPEDLEVGFDADEEKKPEEVMDDIDDDDEDAVPDIDLLGDVMDVMDDMSDDDDDDDDEFDWNE